MLRKAWLLLPPLWLACSTDAGSAVQDHTAQGGQRPNEVVVDTGDDLAWAQHQANLAFATSYQPTCTGGDGGAAGAEIEARPRVLVTGFGRFGAQRINATGLVVSELLEELSYPDTDPPAWDEVDPPGPQTAVGMGTIELEGVGEVDVCAMVLPVFWAAEEAREAQADVEEQGAPFDEVLTGVAFAGYPRASNTYLCNNTTFTVGFALDHPGEPLRLMEASDPRGDAPVAIDFTPGVDGAEVPRWFMHWPSGLRGAHVEAGTEVLRSVMAAQLTATETSRGNPDMADL